MSKLFEDMIVSDEDAAVVARVTDKTVTLTLTVGSAIVVADVLKQAAVALAKDAVQTVLKGNMEEAEMIAMIGMELTNFIDKANAAIGSVDGSGELINIAKRSTAAAKKAKAEPKGTLQ